MSSTLLTGWYGKPAATMAASLMQVPPSGPGNGCEPFFSFQFRIVLNDSMVAILVAHPHTGMLILRHPPVNREVARTSAVAVKAPPLSSFVDGSGEVRR